ncbi:hypothetical protein PTNB85_07089 [Pyrenophora teres f. teres]|nr:hypothetical protein HRS9139_07125 [Pyrenophora teres f. teres]KAE8829672.1 hypothetical protein HRS9122_09487 [Pyrenophora teres f. teres]KAE8830502.1 hypothetical protein PTNB85_07089 [Pyrenophora teres f. teres]KAE8857498.1 hypothetical protein PTNB29_08565 [Pyrenophora teres f. teres]CAE7185353.1 hypothetical protein PTTW11_06792 [Pyrenophora teres f. teres]
MFIHSGRENDAVSTPDDMSSSDSAFLQRATTWIPRAPRIPQGMLPVLQRPVVIPRLDANRLLRTPLPFIRAYSPELRSLDIHERDFVAFIDNLTVAQAPPVPLQALDAAGLAVSMVPHHWMAIAGFSMNVVAGVGTAAMTKTRTCQFLEIVNQKYFGPRGLKSAIYEDEQLVKRLRLDPHMPPLAPPGNNTMPVTVGYRRIEALKPYTASLTFHVPPPIEQRDALDEMAAKQIQRKIKRREDGGHNPEPSTAKQEKRLEKEQKVVARMEYIVVESLNSTGY